MEVRARTEDDLAECVRLAEIVHERDGYPVYLDGAVRDFVVTDDAMAAWVAVDEDQVVGHVALHRHTIPAALELAGAALARPVDELGVVARLFVDPGWRQTGTGAALLGAAAGECRSRGLWPILDVCSRFTPAVALYERCGWRRVGQVDLVVGGLDISELVYVAPGA